MCLRSFAGRHGGKSGTGGREQVTKNAAPSRRGVVGRSNRRCSIRRTVLLIEIEESGSGTKLKAVIGLPVRARLCVRQKDVPRIPTPHGWVFRTKLELAAELLVWAADLATGSGPLPGPDLGSRSPLAGTKTATLLEAFGQWPGH
jgi:hypothetical protein